MADIDVESVLAKLTLNEKLQLLSGTDFWHTASIPRLGVPALRLSDGPNGIRGTKFFSGADGPLSACLPCETGLGATFDSELMLALGQLIGEEAKAKGAHVWLGPTINIQRSPLGGRGFESFSEDPLLSGTLAGFYCQGAQKENIIATPKHFVCNDQEDDRMAVNSILTERALREIYLMPFMIAIKMASPKAIMTAYNKVNGVHASESGHLLKDILRGEWGWDGLVMSDWYGTYSTSEAINAGLDLEMPGSTRWRGGALSHAVLSKKVTPKMLNERVRRQLECVKEAAKSGIPENAPETTLNRPQDQKLLRRAAAESIVLLKNKSGVLPLDKNKPIAVIGPSSKIPIFCGGGSASLSPYYAITPLEGIQKASNSSVAWAQGCYGHKQMPLLGKFLKTKEGRPGFNMRFYTSPPGAEGRECVDDLVVAESNIFLVDYQNPRIEGTKFYADIEALFVPEEDGIFEFGLAVAGTAKLFIDDELVIDNATKQKAGWYYFGKGTVEETGSRLMKQGQEYHLKLEYGTLPTSSLARDSGIFGAGALRFGGCKKMSAEESIAQAVELAKKHDQVVVVVGLNGDWESEGYDRSNMDLPPHNDDLVSQVIAANPNAVVVTQSGTPVYMPWSDDASAILQAWYGGNETGNGLADVLFGDVNPVRNPKMQQQLPILTFLWSGKLPLTIPNRVEDNPAYLNYRSERGRVLYGEDVYVGYRFYERSKVPVRFPFGHGLSYTTFEFSDLQVFLADTILTATVKVINTGSVPGSETVQVYVSQLNPSINRPVKELKGFKKVRLSPGESVTTEVQMELKYVASFWDEEYNAWIMEEGEYEVVVGNSSEEESGVPFLKAQFSISETTWWNGL